MKALVVSSNNSIKIIEKPVPELGDHEVLVKIHAAALNRRDQWIREGKYPDIVPGTTLGSDGAGVVDSTFSNTDKQWQGREVIINPNIGWGEDPNCQSPDYKILGMPVDGTMAEYVRVPKHRLIEKPPHLTFEQAAALPLAGLTAFRALFRYMKITNGTRVLISGFGGGVGQFAGLFALHAGAEVYATSGNPEVLEKAVRLGVAGTYDYHEEKWFSKALEDSGGFDLIIDSAGGDQINSLIKALAPGGKIVFYGATNGLPQNINMYHMFWKQVALQGTTMGNDEEFKQMVKFVNEHKIEPIIGSVRTFENAVASFDEMKTGNRFGKSVLTF